MATKNMLAALQTGLRSKGLSLDGTRYVVPVGPLFDSSSPSALTGLPTNQPWFFMNNGVDVMFDFKGPSSAFEAYDNCPPVAAIVDKKAEAYLNGRTRLVNSQDKEIKPTGGSGTAANLKRLLRQPNPLQSWDIFEAEQKIYLDLFSWSCLLPIMPVGFEKSSPADAMSWWNIPPPMLTVKETNKLFYQTDIAGIISEIILNYKDQKTTIDPSKIYLFRDYRPSASSKIFPTSRLKPLAKPINNIIAAYESRGVLINYAGAQGLLSPEADAAGAIRLNPEDRDQIQSDFLRYGIRQGQFRYIISNVGMKWTAVGRPTKDLQLFEEIVDDIMRVCDGFNFPSPLINTDKGPSMSNTEQFKSSLYEDTIIPESNRIYEQWNTFLRADELNLWMNKDFSHLPILQGNRAEEGRAALYLNQALQIQWDNDQVTWNEWRTANGMDPVPGRDLYRTEMINQGLISATATPATPVDQTQNNTDGNQQ